MAEFGPKEIAAIAAAIVRALPAYRVDPLNFLLDHGWTPRDGGWIDPLGPKKDEYRKFDETIKNDRGEVVQSSKGPIVVHREQYVPAAGPIPESAAIVAQVVRNRDKK